EMIYYLGKNLQEDARGELEVLNKSIDINKLKPPYPQISYDDALGILNKNDMYLEWGKSLGAGEKKALSREFDTLFWI
ncbi:MAG: asparagine--tRNA ligase, partial [Promethearchaeota archaeon]